VTGGGSGVIEWLRSSSCNGGACVEVAHIGELIAVRDSVKPDCIVAFSAIGWRDFIADVKNSEFGTDPSAEP